MAHFNHTKRLKKGDRVMVRLSDGFVGRATVIKHTLGATVVNYISYPCGGHLHVVYDDKKRRLRTIDDRLAEPLDALELLAEI